MKKILDVIGYCSIILILFGFIVMIWTKDDSIDIIIARIQGSLLFIFLIAFILQLSIYYRKN